MAEERVKGPVLSHPVSSSITWFFFSNPNLALFHTHPIYLLFYHELTTSPFDTHFIYINSKHIDPSCNNLFLLSPRVCLRCFYHYRQTSPCCRESCFTVPGWPSRPQLSIWPNTSSFSWMPMPAHPLTPLRSCWRWMSTAREGPLTGSSSP